MYTHCHLVNKRLCPGKEVHETSYIPSKYAILGEILKVKSTSGAWVDGWEVTSVGQEVDESVVNALYRAWKHHAEVSDI